MQEIGYTDTIIDVRSNRVRSLLGLNNNTDSEEIDTPAVNGNEARVCWYRRRQGLAKYADKKAEVNKK